MAVSRRSVLKGLAALPSLYYTLPGIASAKTKPPSAAVGILLFHGLFFMEFSGSQLIVATPDHNPPPPHQPHVYNTRLHHSGLTRLDKDVDFIRQNIFLPGSIDCFPPEVLQFSASLLGGGPILQPAKNYRSKIVLPWPKDIFRLRRAPSSYFHPDQSTKVGAGLKVGTSVATVVGLVYDVKSGSSDRVESYYAQHLTVPDCGEVNAALQSAQQLCGSTFDLSLRKCDMTYAAVDNDAALPSKMDHTDEYSIIEAALGTSIGTKYLPPLTGFKCQSNSTAPMAMEQPTAHAKEHPGSSHTEHGGDVSSCPILGIIP